LIPVWLMTKCAHRENAAAASGHTTRPLHRSRSCPNASHANVSLGFAARHCFTADVRVAHFFATETRCSFVARRPSKYSSITRRAGLGSDALGKERARGRRCATRVVDRAADDETRRFEKKSRERARRRAASCCDTKSTSMY